jgi:hypothetical protein
MAIESLPSAKTLANSEYAQRIDRVIDYHRGNLHRQVKLEELAKVACVLLLGISLPSDFWCDFWRNPK